MTKPAVFKSEQRQAEFDQNGFVKFRMFSPAQVKRLHDFYLQTQPAHETIIDKKKFHATNDTDNEALIADADRFIKDVMFEEIDKHFYNYQTIAASYLVKQPDEQSVLGPHQDLKFVDEQNAYSFNIWVATESTNKTNGGLRFLKASHNFHQTVRPLPNYPWKYRGLEDIIELYLTDIETSVGDCVVLNHACIHASYPNKSNHIRVAAILALMPLNSKIVHYFLPDGKPQNKVEEYEISLEDIVNLKSHQRPHNARLLQSFHHDFSAVSRSEFISLLPPIPNSKQSQPKYGYQYIKQQLSTLFRKP